MSAPFCYRQVLGSSIRYVVQFTVTASDDDNDIITITPTASSTPSSTISTIESASVNSGDSKSFSFIAQSAQSLAEIQIGGTVTDGIDSATVATFSFKPSSNCL